MDGKVWAAELAGTIEFKDASGNAECGVEGGAWHQALANEGRRNSLVANIEPSNKIIGY